MNFKGHRQAWVAALALACGWTVTAGAGTGTIPRSAPRRQPGIDAWAVVAGAAGPGNDRPRFPAAQDRGRAREAQASPRSRVISSRNSSAMAARFRAARLVASTPETLSRAT